MRVEWTTVGDQVLSRTHWGRFSGFNVWNLLLAIGGALLLPFGYRQLKSR